MDDSPVEDCGVELRNVFRDDARYRLLFETIATCVVFQDAEGRIIDANPAAEALLGRPRAELVGLTSLDPRWDATHEDGSSCPGETHPAIEALRTGRPVRHVVLGVALPVGQGRRWFRVDAYPLFRPGEARPFQVYVAFEDVTARKEAEIVLRESEELFRTLFETAADPLFLSDLEGRFVEVNRIACEMLGYPRDELLRVGAAAIDEDLGVEEMKALAGALEPGGTVRRSTRARRRDGSLFPVEVHAGRVDLRGRRLFLVLARDVTERVAAQEALERRERELLAAQRIARVGSWLHDVSTGTSRWTDEVFRIHGLPSGEPVPGVDEIPRLCDAASTARLLPALERLRRDGTPYELELEVTRADGARGTVVARGEAVRDGRGKVTGLRGTVVDITERVRLEAEVEALRQQLAHAARVSLLGELVSSLAHELAQPLTVILSSAQAAERLLARRRPPLDLAREAVADAVAAAGTTATVLDGLRARLRRDEPTRGPIDLNGLAREAVRLVASEARQRDVAIELDLSPDLPRAEGIHGQLDQVLLNLLLNAIEAVAAMKGLRLVRLRTFADAGGLGLAVEDTGPGLPPQLVGRVFEAFFSTRRDGLGLGLTISRSIVEGHGGTIRASAREGGGASFVVRLPRPRQEPG